MRFAFAIFRYFPFGGLQRDMLAMAQEAVARGHQVTVFCGSWDAETPKGIDVVLVDAKRWFGRGSATSVSVKTFVRNFEQTFQRNNFDLLIGFNKMPGLDVYFAGDSCFAQKAFEERNWLYRLAPRSRLYLNYENVVFGVASKTHILSISNAERKQFARYYATAPERFHELPPGISRAQIYCKNPQLAREKIRAELRVDATTKIILCLGSGFKTKGLDRSIAALAALQVEQSGKFLLLIVGADNPDRYVVQAQQLGVTKEVIFLGGRSDIADILQAADVLLHPAYRELAGNVIIEAMLAGLPVVTTDVCGFAHYVDDGNMGVVISAPYEIKNIVAAVTHVLKSSAFAWQERAQQFAATVDLFSRQTRAIEVLESLTQQSKNVASEWIADSDQQIIILRNELIQRWEHQDVFGLVQGLSGSIARELADRQTIRFELDGQGYYRKLHRGVGWREIVKNLLQLRLPVLGAKNEWLALNKLHALDIPSLIPIAYGEQKKNPAKKISFIVTRELSGVMQLDHYFQQQLMSFKEKTMLLNKVAKIARAMHVAGINHRDFYLCHFMLDIESLTQWREDGTEPKMYLIDLHRAQLRFQVPTRWLIKDLSGLYFSSLDLGFTRNDYFRFLCNYWQLSLRTLFATKMQLLNAIELRAIKTYKRDYGVLPKSFLGK